MIKSSRLSPRRRLIVCNKKLGRSLGTRLRKTLFFTALCLILVKLLLHSLLISLQEKAASVPNSFKMLICVSTDRQSNHCASCCACVHMGCFTTSRDWHTNHGQSTFPMVTRREHICGPTFSMARVTGVTAWQQRLFLLMLCDLQFLLLATWYMSQSMYQAQTKEHCHQRLLWQ